MGSYIPVKAWVITTKEEVDSILLNRGKIIVLTEDVPDYLNSAAYGTSCLMANCLLPDYEAVSYYIDGDFQTFSRVYNEMLMNQENTIYFATMIAAMVNDIPLGFIFGPEEIEQAAKVNFLNFFMVMYGIHIAHKDVIGMEEPLQMGFMDPMYVAKNESLLYMNNLFTPQEFLFVYPLEAQIDIQCLNKLMFDLRPPVRDPNDINEAIKYFDGFRSQIKQAKKVLVDPLVML